MEPAVAEGGDAALAFPGEGEAPAPPALREDQIASAVAFLTHPKVRPSPDATKRSFLERKGLTNEEIAEAFARAPAAPAAAPPSAAAPAVAAAAAPPPGGQQLVSYAPQQQQQQQQQPYGSAPPQYALMPAPLPQQPEPVRWTQVLLGLSVVAGAAYAAAYHVAPAVTGWYRSASDTRARRRRAAAERDLALAAALEGMAATQARLAAAVEGLAASVRARDGDGGGAAGGKGLIGYSGGGGEYGHVPERDGEVRFGGGASSHASPARPAPRYGSYGADSPASASASAPAPPGDAFRRAGGGGGGSALAGGAGAVAAGAAYSGAPSVAAPAYYPAAPATAAGDSFAASSAAVPPQLSQQPQQPQQQPPQQQQEGQRPDEPPHSQAFMDIMAMVARGETPPNVRTDIDDAPPDPTRPPTAPQLQPKPKPWERAQPQAQPPAAAAGAGQPWAPASQPWAQQPAPGAGPPQYSVPASGSPANSVGSGRADLSALLGGHDGRDAPWRPPPPPAPTVVFKPAPEQPAELPAAPAAPAPAPAAAAPAEEVAAAQQAASAMAAAAVRAVLNADANGAPPVAVAE
ncbi:hypothetical protein Rsub_08219 [Raphidocelis subcapitata]|uniref:Peroxisomal membrane protein PEX14 n=1 Tax=Raphidocelis subcapitata TaxID=307507 RepID=A0A2V0PD01_9CHLO|nr:hypothetical protein Rsub_08219 [Raphidocelis subcapitata]|eukprot:GBF95783.1 hypothetical protein Rsub_08219 [Raphidocelis subcapitata]